MNDAQDQRRHPRLQRGERLIIQIVGAPDNPALNGHVTSCTSVDLSAGGLRIRLEEPLGRDNRVELWVALEGRRGKFLLSGTVRWCMREETGDAYLAGIEINTGPASDTDSWKTQFD